MTHTSEVIETDIETTSPNESLYKTLYGHAYDCTVDTAYTVSVAHGFGHVNILCIILFVQSSVS